MECEAFLEALASKASTPGGGGAAAFAGAIGISLGCMVGNITAEKSKTPEARETLSRLGGEAEALRLRLAGLVDEDARAFQPLSEAYKLPKDAPGRDAVLEAALSAAAAVPMEIMEACARCIELFAAYEQASSLMLLSDVGCGASLCRAALEAAALNVYANTRLMKEREKADALERRVSGLLERFAPMADAVYAGVTERLKA